MRHAYHPGPFFFHRQGWVLAAFACGVGGWTSCRECLRGLMNLPPSPLTPRSPPFYYLSSPSPTSYLGRRGWATRPILRTLRVSSSCVFHTPFGRSLTDDPPPDAAITLFIITSLVTTYRCSTRYTKKLWGHDDSVALFSLFSFVLFVIGSYDVFRFGATSHRTDDFLNLGSNYLAKGVLLHP